MTAVRVIDTPLACGPLAAAAIAGTAPRDSFVAAPANVTEWKAHCRDVALEHAGWLDLVSPAFGSGAALLERVANGTGVVVTTGQQAGLFGGPMYTWFKALAALEFATELERATGVPAAPVFWAATDDADFAEAATTVIGTSDGAERLTIRTRPAEGVPMSHTPLGEEVNALYARLRAASGSGSDERPLNAAGAFKPGKSIGAAYVAMLRSLLQPLGIAVLDASHASVGEASRDELARALVLAGEIHSALLARQNELRAAGFSAPVEVDRALSLVFAWEPDRDGLPRKRRLTVAESAASVELPLRLSPNVLLRPVIERMLLPTAAYLGGPGELAYFSQVTAVAAAMQAARPLAVPRWSGYVMPADVEVSLKRFDLTPEALRDPHGAEGRLARAALPPNAANALRDLRASIDHSVARMHGILPPPVLEGARDQLLRRADRIERRLVASMKYRELDAMRAVAAARAVLYPFGKPQERGLNGIPLWSRYGDELIVAVRASCNAHARRLLAGERVTA